LNTIINPEINSEDRACLEEFNQIRNIMHKELTNNSDGDGDFPSYHRIQIEDLGTHELLIAEVEKFKKN
jgi:hypothetical protein